MLADTDKEAITRTFEKLKALFRAPVKDWPAFVEFAYDRDAIVMPPNGAAVEGYEAILALLRTFPPFTDYDQHSVEMEGLGDLVYSRDVYYWSPEIPGQTPARDEGKAVVIWRKQRDGTWKVFREIWCSDSPPAKSGAAAQ